MSLSTYARRACVGCLLAGALSGAALADTNFAKIGGEYGITMPLPGDQVHPALSLSPNGGMLVWEDNITDGSGLGITALQLDSGFSAYLAPFRVNTTAANDQERPQVALLKDGGAAIVWQGGKQSFQHIYARFRSGAGTWLNASDVMVNTATNFQVAPVVATLANSNVVVVWSSYNQFSSSSMQDVYGQMFNPAGQKIGGEFLVNQFTSYNQRSPAVTALANGGFAVAWVSEQERGAATTLGEFVYSTSTNQVSVDVYLRLYSGAGTPVSNEILANTTSFNPCASPRLAGASDGTFALVWAEKDLSSMSNSWDIVVRPFSATGVPGAAQVVNTTRYGDQFAPDISAAGTAYMVVWTSLGQDGSMEGVYGRYLRADGSASGPEFAVNTTWISKQIHPVIASDGASRFLAAWSSYVGGPNSFDLFAQRYIRSGAALQPMNAPFVHVPFVVSNNVYQPQIEVSWPLQAGVADHYDVYVDGAALPTATVTSNFWVMTAANGLTAGSTHSFQVDYVATDTRRSPLSPAATATTWMGYSWYGAVPFEWMSSYYGYDTSKWPAPDAPVAAGGPTLQQVFLTGSSPLDPASWLRVSIAPTPEGYFLDWNPQPGFTYQVQTATSLGAWTNFGPPHFAAGPQDTVFIGLSNVGYYRVLRLR